MTFFARAFPDIPLRTLLDAGAWIRLGGTQIDDQEFNALLSRWLGPGGAGDPDRR